MKIALITAADPGRCDYLGELAEDIKVLRDLSNYEIFWSIVYDGKALEKDYGADSLWSSEKDHLQGVSNARNMALINTPEEYDWIYPIDADDRIETKDWNSFWEKVNESGRRWVASNRETIDGKRHPFAYIDRDKFYSQWKFISDAANKKGIPHVNSIAYRRDFLFQLGAWPGLTQHEDLLLSFYASSKEPGLWFTERITRYRLWEKQMIQGDKYARLRMENFDLIYKIINARRTSEGLDPFEYELTTGSKSHWVTSPS